MSKILSVRVVTKVATGEEIAVAGAFEDEKPGFGRLGGAVQSALRRLAANRHWRGRAGQSSEAPVASPDIRTVRLLGLGKRDAFDGDGALQWLKDAASAAAGQGYRDVLFVVPDHSITREPAWVLRAMRELTQLAYRFDEYRHRSRTPRLRSVRLLPPLGSEKHYRAVLRRARPIGRGVALTKDLANTPPNVATPAWMAEKCRALAEKHGMTCTVLEAAELLDKGMGGVHAVGGGSANGPRFVKLEWGVGDKVIALVGKGVTFDTGGISIKSARGMDEMKYDKGGACTVIGIASACAELELPYRFRAYLPFAENMPDGAAYRPGDIIRCYNGKTVEVLNTDAEGRLLLADALAYASEERPDSLVEFSTLTGACVVALGHHGAGLWSPSEALTSELLAAADGAGERLWRMPLWPEFGVTMRGVHADLRNTGERWGSANSAAAFLSQFVKGVERWAHVDIAGTAYVGAGGKETKGATGYGVGLTLDWLLQTAG